MKPNLPALEEITLTPFLRKEESTLEQRLEVRLANPIEPVQMVLRMAQEGTVREIPLGWVPVGEFRYEVFFPCVEKTVVSQFSLLIGDQVTSTLRLVRQPARHWTVHLVQTSHHDLGYTDLPSSILRLHDHWLNRALDYARETDSFPEESQFRIVIEQAWSLEHFLETAAEEKAAEMLSRLKSGRFELNALYGNLTTELCAHEEIIRALYTTARLKRQYGLPVTSAELNDITGFSWGLAEALLGAGVRLFIPGLPLYYDWGSYGLQSFWDTKTMQPEGRPTAFRWETAAGRKLLVWCNNPVTNYHCIPSLPGLIEDLVRFESQNYPFQVLRWPISGANSDNSPYCLDYSTVVREWNQRWAYPHLIFSTNARFYSDLVREDLSGLKCFRGELPGQDYPIGATSTASASAVTRRTHATLSAAETAAATAAVLRGAPYPNADLDEAWREMILHDEHTWGFHFPAGPAGEAAQIEKAAHAYRAAAITHDVATKALAALGENGGSEPCVLVLNTLGEARSDVIRVPLGTLENVHRPLTRIPAGKPEDSYLHAMSLPGREHLFLSSDILAGHFDLIDLSTGLPIPYQVETLPDPEVPLPYAAEQLALGGGSKRLGLFKTPTAIKMDLVFRADNVPSSGYKTYQMRMRRSKPHFPRLLRQTANTIENEYYTITADRSGFTSLYDKQAGRELLDQTAPHRLGEIVVRDPEGSEWISRQRSVRKGAKGPVCVALDLLSEAHGHPRVRQTVRLHKGQKQVELSVKVLKDATPLLDTHLSFPFEIPGANIRYEGSLTALSPVQDYFPGAQSDRLAIQNWVKIGNNEFGLMWSALDSPVASLGGLWEGYVSPAHRCLFPNSARDHRRLEAQDYHRAWIYALLYSNNFGTNFAASQPGYTLFRYHFSTFPGSLNDNQAAAWGQSRITMMETALIPGIPTFTSNSLMQVEGARLLACKAAEDGDGWIIRLWNPALEFEPHPAGVHRV